MSPLFSNCISFLAAGGARFPPPISHSRVAIRQMLGQRHPGGPPAIMNGQPTNTGFSSMAGGPITSMGRQGPMIRYQSRLMIMIIPSTWVPSYFGVEVMSLQSILLGE